MRSFLDELDGRLAELAAETAAAPSTIRPRPSRPEPEPVRRPRAPRGRWAAVSLGCGIAAAIGLLAATLSAGGSATLPILGAPPADASALAGKPGVPPAGRFDLASSRVFPTPDGPGRVILSLDGQRLCVVLPDRAAPGTYGSGCAARQQVGADGLAGEMVAASSRNAPGRALVAFVLPAGTGPELRLVTPEGAVVPVAVHAGVAVATLSTEALLNFEVDGIPRVHRFEAPPMDRTVTVDCGDHLVSLPAPASRGRKHPWLLRGRSELCRQAPPGRGR